MYSLLYLSHLLYAIGEDVSDNNPLLRRRPQVHLDQDNVVEQHQVAHICHLHSDATAEKNQHGYEFVRFRNISKLYTNEDQLSHCKQIQ